MSLQISGMLLLLNGSSKRITQLLSDEFLAISHESRFYVL